MLEFFIEKYRSIDDLRDLSDEEVENIATMQSAHANILEYMYQHTIATKTQQKLSEAAYTVLVTVISTLPFAIAGVIGGLGKGVAKGLYQFPKMLISETLEELFLDPWIESYVSGYAEEHGWSTFWKSMAVSFAESSRETFGSSITQAFSKAFSISTQASQEINSGPQSQADSVQSASQLKADRKSTTLQSVSQIALSTIMLFASLFSPVALIFGTYATQIGMGVVSTVKEVRYKHLLNKIIDSYSEASVQDLLSILAPSKVSNAQTNLVHNEFISIINNKHSLITDEQKNKDKPESLLQKTHAWLKHHKKQIAMYAGVAIAGILTTIGINALFADSMFGSLAGSVTSMGLGTIGMVKQQDSTLDKDVKKVKIQQTVDGKSLLPSKADRIISREFGGEKHHTQEYMKNLWKLGKLEGEGGDYVFGMIYQWTHEKSGKVHVYPGRTERRGGTPNYRPYSSISIRFQEEIETAITTSIPVLKKKKRNPMYYDMRLVFDSAGRGQRGINAIIKEFKLEIVEILLISDSYTRDCKIIEQLEDYWMDIAKSNGYELYAAAGGSSGSHVAEERSGHAIRMLHSKVKDFIGDGFSKRDMANYFGFPWSDITHTSAKLDGLIRAVCGKSYTQARLEYVGNRLISLIDNGILTLSELASYFKGMTVNDMFSYLGSKGFIKGNIYLTGLISSSIIKIANQNQLHINDVTGAAIALDLGLEPNSDHLVRTYLKNRMKTITRIAEEDLISWLRPYAKIIIKHCNKASIFIEKLGWVLSLSRQETKRIVYELFGVSFEQARRIFSDGFLTLKS